MASKPGILTDWPWTPLGSFKHAILAPWVAYTCYRFLVEGNKDVSTFLIFPFLLWRMLHNQIWISLSRLRTANGTRRILDKGIEFDQVDRESNWDDQILFNGILFYVGVYLLKATHLPLWRADGVILTAIIHSGPVEFLYYWLHRALHHHYLYSRYHSHHHASIVTEPITSVIHPFAEHISYFALFAIPMLTTVLSGTASVVSFAGYITYIDFMNNMGHCNFELVPGWLFSIFPFLKYFMYTASYHSVHHTKFRTNYSLFMPIYDHIYGTADRTSDELYRSSATREAERAHVVHLTHLTTPESIYHLRLGFAFLASRPHNTYSPNHRYMAWLLRPITHWIYARTTFIVERNRLHGLTLQMWVLPKYTVQYNLAWQSESINGLIEEAILEADDKGAKVISLGLMNQGEDLNRYGEIYVEKYGARMRGRLVDGSSLAVAIVINNILRGTTEVALRGSLSKVARAIVFVLCNKGIQVVTHDDDVYEKLKRSFGTKPVNNLRLSKICLQKTWIVGEGLSEEDQKSALKGTLFIPYSQIPPKQTRKDCFYHHTPAMTAPSAVENVDSCENWLPRRAMSASRVAGIVHALEGWDEHECGPAIDTAIEIDKVWKATLKHGFLPLTLPAAP